MDYWGYIGVLLGVHRVILGLYYGYIGLYWGNIGVIWELYRLYRDNGKENGNYYNIGVL